MRLVVKRMLLLLLPMGVAGHAMAFCLNSVTNTSPCPQTEGKHWPTSSATFHTQIFGTVPANQQATATAFSNAYQQATTQWNNQSNFAYSSVNNAVDPCSTIHTQGASTQGWGFGSTLCGTPFGGSTLAVTLVVATVSPVPNQIVDADIIFNSAKVFDVHAGNQNGPGAGCIKFVGQPEDFTRVAVHELGHALGLGHEQTNPAIMAPVASECIESPQTDDINGLRALYGGTGNTTCIKSGYVPRVTVKPGANNSTIYLRTSSLASSYKRFTTTDTKLIKAAVKSLPGRTYVQIKGNADCTTATSGGAAQYVIVAP